MKNLFFYTTLLIWCLMTPCQLPAQELFHLEAQVKNCPSNYAVFYDKDENDTIPINSDGTLKFDKVMNKPYYASLIIPKVQMFMGIWAENGKEALVTVDANNASEAVLTGSTLKESEQIKQVFGSLARWNPTVSSFTEHQKAWSLFTDSLRTSVRQLGNPSLDLYLNDLLKEVSTNKLANYYHQLLRNGQRVDSDTDFNRFMASQDISKISDPSDGFLFNYLGWKAQCVNPTKGTDYYTMLKVLHEHVSIPAVKDDLSFRLFMMLMTSQQTAHAEEAYQLAMGMTTPDTQQRIQTFYLSSSRPEGSEIEDFNVLDINEQPFSFKSICNKSVVYVDVWSTWCVPCCREIPYVAKLVEKYKDNPNVKFVSLSIDKNRANWKKFLAKQADTWEQYLVPEDIQRQFFNIFAINGIPRFMVFDGRGRIININEVRPSADNIEEILNGYLQRYK